jgi:hypothetical protein
VGCSVYGDRTALRKYRDWGNLDDDFDSWFEDNWKRLFAVQRNIEVIREDDDRIVISIPLDEPITNVLSAVRNELASRQGGARARRVARKSSAKYVVDAENLKYAPLRAYLRILALDRKHDGNRDEVIKDYHAWARQRNAKVRRWQREKRAAGKQLKIVDEAGWDLTTDRARAQEVVARYLKKGRKLLENTIAGHFPGRFDSPSKPQYRHLDKNQK